MAWGPGKYDHLCTLVREKVGMVDTSPGGVVVVVFGGDKGHGFSVQADLQTTLALPDILESIAKQIRQDGINAGET